jgi:hypothetical protein
MKKVIIALVLTSSMALQGFQVQLKLKQFASCLKPQHLTLVARAQIKRPSFWLGVAGMAAFAYAEKHTRDIAQARVDWQTYQDAFMNCQRQRGEDLDAYEKRRQNLKDKFEAAETEVGQKRERRKVLRNRAFGVLFFAGLARYKGY